MTEYGVVPTGFVSKPLEVIKAEIEEQQRADISVGLNQAVHKVLGQLNGIFSEKLREAWELIGAVYSSRDPDAAVDAALDDICALCPGIFRDAAEKSTVTGTANLNAGITLPVGNVASVDVNPAARFVTTEAVTNPGGSPANISVAMEAEETGPVYANANTLEVIETPVVGWNSITNAAAADPGENIEINTDLRLRRESTIRLAGSTHVEAIKADVLQVDGVEDVRVFENDTDSTVGTMTPHSVRVIIWDGSTPAAANADVWAAIHASKAGGIKTIGAVSGTVEDSMGFDHTIRFDRATEKTLFVEVDVTTDDDYAGDEAVEEAVEDLADAYTIGDDVIVSKISAAAADVEGVTDVTEVRVGWSDTPTGTINLTVDDDEIAVLQEVEVTST